MRVSSHECGRCGKSIPKAKRIFLGIVYCSSCYVREFSVVACRTCGQPARVHKSVGYGLCRTCECNARLCIRCDGPVPRAALRIPEGAVCKKCRRYFEPAPKKYPRADGYETCSTCRRHRKVAKYDEKNRPVCVQCDADPQHAEQSQEEQHAYWFARLVRQTHSLKEALESTEWQDLFVQFVQSIEERMDPGSLVMKLPRFIKAFSLLEGLSPTPTQISPEVLLEKLSTGELRRMELVTTFLHNSGFKVPTRERAERASEQRRIRQSIAEVNDSIYSMSVEAFVTAQMATFDGECVRKLRSIRLNVRAAVELLKFVGDKRVDSVLIAQFLKQSPGRRACLFAFVGYLRTEYPALQMPTPPPRAGVLSEGGNISYTAATTLLTESTTYIDLRAGLAGWLVATFGIPLTIAARMTRSSLTISKLGEVAITLNGRVIQLPETVRLAVWMYIELRDGLAQDRSEWLFPGRPLHHPMTAEGLRVRLVKHHILPSTAGRAARAKIVKAAERAY